MNELHSSVTVDFKTITLLWWIQLKKGINEAEAEQETCKSMSLKVTELVDRLGKLIVMPRKTYMYDLIKSGWHLSVLQAHDQFKESGE